MGEKEKFPNQSTQAKVYWGMGDFYGRLLHGSKVLPLEESSQSLAFRTNALESACGARHRAILLQLPPCRAALLANQLVSVENHPLRHVLRFPSFRSSVGSINGQAEAEVIRSERGPGIGCNGVSDGASIMLFFCQPIYRNRYRLRSSHAAYAMQLVDASRGTWPPGPVYFVYPWINHVLVVFRSDVSLAYLPQVVADQAVKDKS